MWNVLVARLTNLGDPILLSLGGLGIFLYLWSAGERRFLALSWALAFGLCVLLTIGSKFFFHLVHWNAANALQLISPSGHVAIGTCFYGCCAVMLSARRNRTARVLLYVGAALLLGVIAATRIVLGCHSLLEIIVAFGIGGASLMVFIFYPGNKRPMLLNAPQIISLLLLIFVTYYIPHVDGESLLTRVVQKIDHGPRTFLVFR